MIIRAIVKTIYRHVFFQVDVVGLPYACLFPSKKYHDRLSALYDSSFRDGVTIKKYMYRKQNAYAVMSDKLGADIGVIPKSSIPELEKRYGDPDGVAGRIIYLDYSREDPEDDNNSEPILHWKCRIQLSSKN